MNAPDKALPRVVTSLIAKQYKLRSYRPASSSPHRNQAGRKDEPARTTPVGTTLGQTLPHTSVCLFLVNNWLANTGRDMEALGMAEFIEHKISIRSSVIAVAMVCTAFWLVVASAISSWF